MSSLITASATTAGALISGSSFKIPTYQREYAWTLDEIKDFWADLKESIANESYFLGLVILTEASGSREIVDGQQRILSLTLLASALHQAALKEGRSALARKIQSDFLRVIDYETDEEVIRVTLADEDENDALATILSDESGGGFSCSKKTDGQPGQEMKRAYSYICKELERDLSSDPFKRLGQWVEFISDRLYFAVFVHPDRASAYKVFEVINTRGRGLTTADLLKNFVLSEPSEDDKKSRYDRWQRLSKSFSSGGGSFVQYIRHVVTVECGHVLPKNLYEFLSGKLVVGERKPPSVDQLLELLEKNLPLYLQMVDPTSAGPATDYQLRVFSALNELGVVSVRPLLLAAQSLDEEEAFEFVLRFVVLRMVVGNLGTGNVERRIGDTAHKVSTTSEWMVPLKDLSSLIPTKEEFRDKLCKRDHAKGTLAFIRRSIVQETKTPEAIGTFHYLMAPYSVSFEGFNEEDFSFYARTLGNTILTDIGRRPQGIDSWSDIKDQLLSSDIDPRAKELRKLEKWNAQELLAEAEKLAERAIRVWF